MSLPSLNKVITYLLTSPLCRVCNKQEETVDHIMSVCSELTKTDYLERANKAAAYYPLEGLSALRNGEVV